MSAARGDVAVVCVGQVVILLLVLAASVRAQEIAEDISASSLASTVLQRIQSHLTSASTSLEGRSYGGYGGCTDSFSIFGFLAFLLALLDLVLELQGMDAADGMARGRRDVGDESETINFPCQEDLEVQEVASASYSLLRGFLNALATDDPECANKFLCEAAEEAAAAGTLGKVVARVASLNAASWLLKVNATVFAEADSAGQAGALTGGCALRYSQCFSLPAAYRYPGVFRGPAPPSHIYEPVLQEIMDVARDALL